MFNRKLRLCNPWLAAMVFALCGFATTALAAPLPGGTLNPLTIDKYVTPLVIPPVMPNNGMPDSYDIAVRQFKQQILPAGLPSTTVWSYGAAADPTPLLAPDPPLTTRLSPSRLHQICRLTSAGLTIW
jgi:hypothetical protein